MNSVKDYFIRKWEYLPSYILHFPTVFIYLYFSIKARSFLFFTNVSHDYTSSDIENSSKYRVYEKLNSQFYPTTALIRKSDITDIRQCDIEQKYKLNFPIIVKPNIGKRGLGAILINSYDELVEYGKYADYDILLQEYIGSLHECGIFYIKHPGNQESRITSIGIKRLPTLVGDGVSNLKELIVKDQVSAIHQAKVANRFDLQSTILKHGEELIMEPIGAHNRGAMITAANHLISTELLHIIEQSISGMNLYYGRMDIKYNSWEKLISGDFKIIEVNTITSEPLSIYDRNISIIGKYGILYAHIKCMYEISTYLKSKGRPVSNIRDFIKYINNYREHLKRLGAAKV